MKILITGGSGFIATGIARRCVDLGHRLYIQTSSGHIARDLLLSPQVKVFHSPFTSLDPSELHGLSAIFHLACAGVSPRSASWEELNEVNICGALHICHLAKATNSKLIVSGSFAEYGKSAENYERIPVDAPLLPTYPYAVSKAVSSQMFIGYAISEGLQLGYLRIFNAYGPGQHPSNLWPSLVRFASSGSNFEMTAGEQVRDFIYIDDLVNCMLTCLDDGVLQDGHPLVLNAASGNSVSVGDFCSYWWRRLNASGDLKLGALPYRENEIMRYVPSMDHKYF